MKKLFDAFFDAPFTNMKPLNTQNQVNPELKNAEMAIVAAFKDVALASLVKQAKMAEFSDKMLIGMPGTPMLKK